MLNDCKLTKISRWDLRGLENLKVLNLRFNAIEELPRGLFEFTPNLECISLPNNMIKDIDADLLDPLENLQFFDLTSNPMINVKYDAVHNEGNITLQQLKIEIKMLDPNEKHKAEMRKEILGLKKNFVALKELIDAVKEENVELKKENSELSEKIENLEMSHKEQKVEIEKLKVKPIVNDFSVIIKGKVIRVNKDLLTANSPVLRKLIQDNRHADQLELNDISEETFKHVLEYMETKQAPARSKTSIELYAACARFEIESLADFIAFPLIDKITLENANDIMKLAMKFKHLTLAGKAFEKLQTLFVYKEEKV
jgi:hypothetical protein